MTQPFLPLNRSALTGLTVRCVGVRLCDKVEEWIQAVGPFTTENERQHADRYSRPMDGLRHLVGRALAHRILGKTAQVPIIDFASNPWGKPFCKQTGMEFSISHSGNAVWVAFNPNGKVGIDVEQVREVPDLLSLATMFHPEEYSEIRKQPLAELPATFYRCWVRKEAVVKACGEGLSRSFHSFCVHTDKRTTGWLKCIGEPAVESWFTHDIFMPGEFACSLACPTSVSGVNTLFLSSIEQFRDWV